MCTILVHVYFSCKRNCKPMNASHLQTRGFVTVFALCLYAYRSIANDLTVSFVLSITCLQLNP